MDCNQVSNIYSSNWCEVLFKLSVFFLPSNYNIL